MLHLRKLGYDIVSIAEGSPSISDAEVLTKANEQDRIILTNDKDFGDLVFLTKLKHSGVVLFRLKSEKAVVKIKVLENLLKTYTSILKKAFIVVDESRVRIREKH